MATYGVTVEFTQKKVMKIYSKDDRAARLKAERIITNWDGVKDVEVLDVALAENQDAQ